MSNLRIEREPYPHLRDDQGCVLASDYEAAGAENYVRKANDWDRLAALNKELVQFVQGCANVFALQAYRDSSDPDALDGWRKLQEQANALVEKHKP